MFYYLYFIWNKNISENENLCSECEESKYYTFDNYSGLCVCK